MFNKSRRPMTMHQATCAECGRSCQVPFKPSGDKPVFCSDCFEGKEDSRPPRRDSGRSGGGYERRGSRDFGGRRDSGRRDYGRDDRSERRMYQAVCDKCGETCEVPFQPTSGKPIFCDGCFGKGDRGGRSSGGAVSPQQFEELNAKLDKILKLLNPGEATEKAEKIEKPKKTDEKEKAEKIEKKVAKKETKKEIKKASKAKKAVKKTAKKKS